MSDPQVIGRYTLFGEIASGGMASVHYGRISGPAGFARTVAIKRLHPHLAKDPEFVAMLLDEARLTARIRHPNVASVTDVVIEKGEVLLVMDYVHGESLARLVRAAAARRTPLGLPVISGVMVPALHGLHAAHTAKSETGQSLHIVHRDFTPQNLLVGQDGVPRIVDFGVARAVGRLQATREGQLKGKPAYMAPEQIVSDDVDARTDLFAAAIMLWEMLTLRRLFAAANDAATVNRVLTRVVDPPSRVVPDIPAAVDAVVMRGLARDPSERFQSALQMAQALEAAITPGSAAVVSGWVQALAAEVLSERAATVSSVETGTPSIPLHLTPADEGASPPSRLVGEPRHRTGRGARTLLVGAGALALVGIGAAIGGRSCVSEPAAQQPTAEVITSIASAGLSPPPPTAEAPPVSPSAVPSQTAVPALPKPRAAPVRAKPTPASANCNPSYVVDERGVVRWKRECLGVR